MWDVTSVPWRLVACVARVLIFSLYSWAALLLYLALAALDVHPCWLKNAICHQEQRHGKVNTSNEVTRGLNWRHIFLYLLTALVLPPTCMHLSWNHDQLKSSSVDLDLSQPHSRILGSLTWSECITGSKTNSIFSHDSNIAFKRFLMLFITTEQVPYYISLL